MSVSFETAHLTLDDLGVIRWVRDHGTSRWPYVVGNITDEPDWPFPADDEPKWYATELAELADEWTEWQAESEAERALRRAEADAMGA